jgi:predicted component of type VI protein secretion system
MDLDRLGEAVSPGEQAAGVERFRARIEQLNDAHQHGEESLREVTYGKHTIRIATTYDIQVDGKPVTGHMLVTNEGSVHYHAIPNQEFASAVDMVKRMIDLAPDQFPDPPPIEDEHPEHGQHQEHGEHGQHGQHGDHPDVT